MFAQCVVFSTCSLQDLAATSVSYQTQTDSLESAKQQKVVALSGGLVHADQPSVGATATPSTRILKHTDQPAESCLLCSLLRKLGATA